MKKQNNNISWLRLLFTGVALIVAVAMIFSYALPAEEVAIPRKPIKVTGGSANLKKLYRFHDVNDTQIVAAQSFGIEPLRARTDIDSMLTSQLWMVETSNSFKVEKLTHSVPYLIPSAKRELDSIGAEWADILRRNGLPHYRFYVTSVLRTQEDIKYLQRSGNIYSVTQSCHCYGTTFDLAYMRYDKVTHTRDYMVEDNLKLVLGQVLLNEQRKGHVFVKYEAKQSCFHVTCRR